MKNHYYFLLLFFFMAGPFCQGQEGEGSVVFLTGESRFIPNQGQVVEADGESRTDVLFKVEREGIYLRETGVSFVLAQPLTDFPKFDPEKHVFTEESTFVNTFSYKRHQVDLNFLEINPDFKVEINQSASDYYNYYFSGSREGITKVKPCQNISYKDIYDGVDVLFNYQNGLKYDFVIHPGADPGQIRMNWEGADAVSLSNDTLVIKTVLGTIHEKIPLAYQLINDDTVQVKVSYQLLGNGEEAKLGFEWGQYNPNYDLIIDPWITNYGGSSTEYGLEVDTDSEGNVYMSGETYSLTAIAESGFQEVFGGGISDAFLAKFNADGERLWATYYGGTGGNRERGNGVAVDLDGNCFVGGITDSPTGIASIGAFQEDFAGGLFDAFLVKFASDGTRIWGTYYGGVSEDYAMNAGVDIYGNAYLCGYTFSETDFAVDGHQMDLGGFADGFLVKFDPDGNREWATYYGGENAEIIHDVEGDIWGNIFVSGITTSSDQISSPGVFQEDIGGGQDAFLVKFDQAGNREWGTYFGQLWVERGDAVTTDTVGNVYMAGKTTAPTGTATPDAFQEESGGISDAFLAKFDENGEQLWATYIGGDSIDYAFGVDVDKITNNVVVSGQTYSRDYPVAPCATQDELTGFLNAFITQFLPDGELFCSSYLGVADEEENVVAVHDCRIYVVGTTLGNMSTPGAHQTIPGGDEDAFLAQVHVSSCELTLPDDWTAFEQTHEDVTSCTPCNGSATIDISDLCLHPRSLKTYVWSNGFEERYTTDISSTIEGICEGEYWVAVTINCDQTDTFYFDIGNSASITANYTTLGEDFDVCVGEPISFENLSSTVFGEITVNSWSFGDGTGSDLENPEHVYDEPGVYDVLLAVENDSECKDSMTRSITVFPVYELTIDTLVCEGDAFTFPDGETITVTENMTRDYEFLTVNGCDSLLTVHVIYTPVFTQNINVTLNEGDYYVFPDGTDWIAFSDTMQTSNFTTNSDCDSLIITTITVIEIVPPTPEIETWLEKPNIFTPGSGNESNNTFYFPSAGVANFRCVITNRWGVEVFRFNDIVDVWDGTNQKNGEPCVNGVYFYSYTGTFVDGKIFSGQGNVQLVRDE